MNDQPISIITKVGKQPFNYEENKRQKYEKEEENKRKIEFSLNNNTKKIE